MNKHRLTIPQQNIWNLKKYYECTSISNICGMIMFVENVDFRLIEEATRITIKDSNALRLNIFEEDGQVFQEETDNIRYDFICHEFSDKKILDDYIETFSKEVLPKENNQLFKIEFAKVENNLYALVCFDHLIADAWSMNLFAYKVYERYIKLLDGHKVQSEVNDYFSFLGTENKYLASKAFERDKIFWHNEFEDRPERSGFHHNYRNKNDARANRKVFIWDKHITERLQDLNNSLGYSPAVIFETAILIYLKKINAEAKNTTIGILALNRSTNLEKDTLGMFISTLPLNVQFDLEISIDELMQKVASKNISIFRHRRYPVSNIIQDVKETHDHANDLYEVIVSYQNAKIGIPVKTEWCSNGYCEVPLEIHIDNREETDEMTVTFDYQVQEFTECEIDLMNLRINSIVNQIIDDASKKISHVQILSEKERYVLMNDFNNTSVKYDDKLCVQDLIAEQIAKKPNKEILFFENQSFTYSQLDSLSNSLARYLRERGVTRNTVVPVISKRDWRLFVAMLAVLKAGGAYLLVDVTYPQDRIDYMLEISNATIGLKCGYYSNCPIELIDLSTFDYSYNTSSMTFINEPEDLCYVIFTSGSTGKPKGLTIMHKNIVNFSLSNDLNYIGQIITEDDGILGITTTTFDMSVLETLLPLVVGYSVFFANDEQVLSQDKLVSAFDWKKISVFNTTPTKMKIYMLDEANTDYLKNIKAFALGGEALPDDMYGLIRKYSDGKIFNCYGPAETTIYSSLIEVKDSSATVGKPVSNTQIYIVDKDLNLLPIGVAGELCIAGDGVGAGYINRPDLTEEKYILNPFATEENGHGKFMYRTGDFARWRVDGEIDYLGRIDTQVKIRGLRIELGEIESVMASYPGVILSAATDKKDETGRQYLVGYYTSDCEIDEKGLRKHLSSALPRYMLPNYFVHMQSIPMTASGKIDRKNLPAPEFTYDETEYVAPTTELQIKLCNILADIFEVDNIGIEDDFFDIGGDSLGAISYTSMAHSKGIEFSLQDIFDYPTVALLSEHIVQGEQEKVTYSDTDFEKYTEILEVNKIDDSFIPQNNELGNALITGSTGFLGAHIIDAYLKTESGNAYCLVRGNEERLVETLKYYFEDKYTELIGTRIIPVVGDITNDELCDKISMDIQTIFHTAASVKHYGPYSYFEEINVKGTKNVIKCAKKLDAKLIHISTLSVSGNSLADDFSTYRATEEIDFKECCIYIGQPLDNVYIHSKFEAE